MALELSVAPAVEPVSLAELKLHVRTSGSAEDTLLAIYIAAARRNAETLTRRALVDQTWIQRLDEFGGEDKDGNPVDEIKLLMPPVRSITSVTYIDTDGATQTLPSSRYSLDKTTLPGWLYPADGYSWPDTDDVLNAVAITFVAGYGSAGSDVPADIRAWILMVAGFLYSHREAMDAEGRIAELPGRFLDGLLDQHIVFGV